MPLSDAEEGEIEEGEEVSQFYAHLPPPPPSLPPPPSGTRFSIKGAAARAALPPPSPTVSSSSSSFDVPPSHYVHTKRIPSNPTTTSFSHSKKSSISTLFPDAKPLAQAPTHFTKKPSASSDLPPPPPPRPDTSLPARPIPPIIASSSSKTFDRNGKNIDRLGRPHHYSGNHSASSSTSFPAPVQSPASAPSLLGRKSDHPPTLIRRLSGASEEGERGGRGGDSGDSRREERGRSRERNEQVAGGREWDNGKAPVDQSRGGGGRRSPSRDERGGAGAQGWHPLKEEPEEQEREGTGRREGGGHDRYPNDRPQFNGASRGGREWQRGGGGDRRPDSRSYGPQGGSNGYHRQDNNYNGSSSSYRPSQSRYSEFRSTKDTWRPDDSDDDPSGSRDGGGRDAQDHRRPRDDRRDDIFPSRDEPLGSSSRKNDDDDNRGGRDGDKSTVKKEGEERDDSRVSKPSKSKSSKLRRDEDRGGSSSHREKRRKTGDEGSGEEEEPEEKHKAGSSSSRRHHRHSSSSKDHSSHRDDKKRPRSRSPSPRRDRRRPEPSQKSPDRYRSRSRSRSPSQKLRRRSRSRSPRPSKSRSENDPSRNGGYSRRSVSPGEHLATDRSLSRSSPPKSPSFSPPSLPSHLPPSYPPPPADTPPPPPPPDAAPPPPPPPSPPPFSPKDDPKPHSSSVVSNPPPRESKLVSPTIEPIPIKLPSPAPQAPRPRPLAVTKIANEGAEAGGSRSSSRPGSPRRAVFNRTPVQEEVAFDKEFEGTSDPSKYPIAGKLGEGTFGEVHKSTTKTGLAVALKRILVHSENDGVPITTLREIKLLKALSHTNVVPVIDMILARGDESNHHRGKLFMVFPFADHDLAGLLENPEVSWDQKLIKLYAQQLLRGTNYLHANNILHRDMKTANLLINNKGVLQIADFGLARTFSAGGDRGGSAAVGGPEYTNMVVTRWYRPPELLLGLKQYGPSIDMWGVGCVIAEMFDKKPIMQGNSDPEQLSKIWEICGSPSEANFPNWNQWGGCEGTFPLPRYPLERKVVERFSKQGSDFGDFMDKLLILDPAKRMSAREALEHKWFWTLPLPMKPEDLPEWASSHEMTRKKKPVALPPPPPPPPTNVGYPTYPPPGFGGPIPPAFAPYGQQQQQQQQGFPPLHQQHQQGYNQQQPFRPPGLVYPQQQQNPYGNPQQQQQQPIYGHGNQQMYGQPPQLQQQPSFPLQQQQPNRTYPLPNQTQNNNNNFRPNMLPRPPPPPPNPYGNNHPHPNPNPQRNRAPVFQASTTSKPTSNFGSFIRPNNANALSSSGGGVAVRPPRAGAGVGGRPGMPPSKPSTGASGSGGAGLPY